jgi:hypothetical protein
MKKWFMENGFKEGHTLFVKNLEVMEDDLRFWIEYDSFNNKLTILKIFRNYDIDYREVVLSEEDDVGKIIKQLITKMKTYLTYGECEILHSEGFFNDSYIEDMRWFREL